MDQVSEFHLNDFIATVRTRWGAVTFDRRDRYIGSSLNFYGEYAANEIAFLLHYVTPGMQVLDIGANIGTHTVAFESQGADVLAFEPQPAIFQILQRNIRRGQAFNYALGAANTTAFLTPAENNGNSGGVSVTDQGSIEVPVQRLDDFDLARVGLMKIDVEGFERDVLIGAEQTIRRCRPLIYFENDRPEKSEALLRWLMNRSYELYWHTPALFDPHNPCGRQDDIFPRMVAINVFAIPVESKVERPELHRISHPRDASVNTVSRQQEAETLTMMASGLIVQKHCASAIAMLRRAIALEPTAASPWAELGVALHALGRYDAAVKALNRALLLDPGHLNAKSNLALVQGILGEWDTAEAMMQALMEIPERRVAERIHYGLMLLTKGDWERGLDAYEQRVGVIVKEFKLPKLGVPYWTGEDISGKTLYIQTEQGIGDTIAFSRYLAWVAERYPTAKLKLSCHFSHENLLWDYRHIAAFVPTGVLWPTGDERFDYGIYLHSLARLAGARPDNIYSDPGLIRRRVEAQRDAIPFHLPPPARPNCRKVGIVWTGNPENPTQVRRSVPLEIMLWLATDPANVLYSLQCGEGQRDLARIGAHALVEDLSEAVQPDLVMTGVALLHLDVLVTCCTSVAHLAGALGVPTFLLLCHDPYWVWGREAHSTPWYPSVRLFRQQTRGDWESVIRDVASALRTL